jgi:hypothetical protein
MLAAEQLLPKMGCWGTRFRKSEVARYLLQQLYANTRLLPLHELLQDLKWIGNPKSSGAPPLRAALHRNVLRTDYVVDP